jgi:ABC-type nitrate/sulfonate/bicarbonate transport system permease component
MSREQKQPSIRRGEMAFIFAIVIGLVLGILVKRIKIGIMIGLVLGFLIVMTGWLRTTRNK